MGPSRLSQNHGSNCIWVLLTTTTCSVSWAQYMTQILADFHLEICNVVKTLCPAYYLTTAMCPMTDNEQQSAVKLPYCAIVGKCMYLSNCTHPNISFVLRQYALSDMAPELYIVDSERC